MSKLNQTNSGTDLSGNLFNAIANQTTEGITVADMEGNYLYVNQAFCEMSGFSEKELLEKTVFDMKAENQNHQSFYDSKEEYEGKSLRVNLQRKDGTEYLTEIIGDVIEVDGKKQVLGTIRDISKQIQAEKEILELNKKLKSKVGKRTEELKETIETLNNEIIVRNNVENQLKDSLEVKETLLQEITHRVKNNLQVISSILNLQKNTTQSDETRKICEETSNRIQSMALIHESLYTTHDFSDINFEDYIDSLVFYLSNVFEVTRKQFQLNIEVHSLSIDSATCCGMIASELITNSLKYALPGDKYSTKIVISLKHLENGTLEFFISDNGIGLPKDMIIEEVDSLGLQLVLSLADQLEGNLIIGRENGASYTIQFSDSNEQRS